MKSVSGSSQLGTVRIPMDLHDWSRASKDYGRKLLDSGIEGARSGQEAYLNGNSLSPFLSESAQNAMVPAALGACIGVLSSCAAFRQKSVSKALSFGILGAAVGLAAGLAWESRCLAASVAESAFRNIGRVRDEHWLERHPIDYA